MGRHYPRKVSACGLPHLRARGIATALAALSLPLLPLLVGGCGSGGALRAGAAHASTRSAAPAARCRATAAPTPKGPQHLQAPHGALDPTMTYTAHLETNCGEIEIRLDVRDSPRVAASFVHLVHLGFYNGLTFHRVVAGFVIQGGDPNGDGSGGPGYTVVEPPPSNLQYTQGVVAMAKTDTDPAGAAGSQFFIVTGANADLPPQYALLGRVVGGQQTVAAISRVPTAAGPDGEESMPRTPIVMNQVTVSAK